MNQLLNSFIPIAHLIKRSIVECEVVIHDLTMPQNSVVFVLGDVTGRKVGQSFDHLIKEVILSKDFDQDCTANYYFHTNDGLLVRSSTALIRNEAGKVIGALCVNFSTQKASAMLEFAQSLLPNLLHTITQENKATEQNIATIAEDIINQAMQNLDTKKLKRQDKKQVVKFLYDKGIFEVKGTIEMVANALNLQKVTIYAYLDEMKK